MKDDNPPILYTDNINISANDDGVILSFYQKIAPDKEMGIVSRIGMSREHAKKFINTLAKQLALGEAQSQSGNKSN